MCYAASTTAVATQVRDMQEPTEGRPPTGIKPRPAAGQFRQTQQTGRRGRKVALVFVIVFLLLIILGGIDALVVGLTAQQEAAKLAVAPVCAYGQTTGCKLDEKVTVVDLYTNYPSRSAPEYMVDVRVPDGSTQQVQAHDNNDLFPLLRVSEKLNAELWNGSIIQMDDGAGHRLVAEDSPVVTGSFLPVIGVLAIIGGALLLVLLVRNLPRQ
jgi:hypothetical protein